MKSSHDLEISFDPNVPRLSKCSLLQLNSLSKEAAKALFLQHELNHEEFTQNMSLNSKDFCIFYQEKWVVLKN